MALALCLTVQHVASFGEAFCLTGSDRDTVIGKEMNHTSTGFSLGMLSSRLKIDPVQEWLRRLCQGSAPEDEGIATLLDLVKQPVRKTGLSMALTCMIIQACHTMLTS
jgi:hypothetical protein